MPGRPRSFDRDRAVDVALDAFWRDGYQRTSVAELTRDMGINPPSLYAAFGDKERLFGEAAERYIERFRSGLADALGAPTAHAAVSAVLEAAALAHTEPGTPPGCLVLSEPRLAGERARMREELARRLARGRTDGDVPDDVDPDRFAAYLDAVLTGMSARAREGGDRAELTAIAQFAAGALPAPIRAESAAQRW